MKTFLTLIKRDVRLSALRGGGVAASLFFFVMVASLFPLALGADRELLQGSGAAVIWICALLASLLSLEQVYHRDFDDGSMDLMMLAPVSPFVLSCAKIAAHWLCAGLPLFIAAGFVAQMFNVDAAFLPLLLLSLFTGTVYMSLLGGFGAFLTLGSRRPGVLLALVVLPLYIPMLLLGMMAAEAALAGTPPKAYLLLQIALVIAALPLALLASSALLKMHLRSN